MNNLINHLYKLIKSAYLCKSSIKKCLKHDVNTPSYGLAKFYKEQFTALETCRSLTMDEIELIVHQINVQRIENKGSEDTQLLLTNIFSFLEELKPFIRKNVV